MKKTNPSVDGYIRKNKEWENELNELRKIVLDTELVEEIKWRSPCYTFEGHNVCFIGNFKDNCVLSFIKGALLKDPKNLLEKPGENTQSARVVRFTNVQEIRKVAAALKSYIKEAIELERSGQKVEFKAKHELVYPEELIAYFKEMPELEKAFKALTPGRQRGYVMFISAAKQSATRTARVEKHIDNILAGKGIMDDYRAKR